jgi:hypothetical protein
VWLVFFYLASCVNTFTSGSASYTDRGWTFVHENISRTNDGERGAGTQGIHCCPAVPHTVFVRRCRHNVPECTVSARPVFLEESGIHIVAKPVAGMVLSTMFGQTGTLIVFVIEPVHLKIIIRIDGIQITSKH